MSEIVAEGIIEASALREYLGVFTPLVSEGRIHFNDDGLATRVTDPAMVALVAPGALSTRAFESYDAPGAVTIGVNLEKLVEKVKPANGSDLVHLAVDMETRHLKIQYGRANLSQALIDPDSIRKEPDEPDLEFPNQITIEGALLSEAVKISDLVSDHVTLSADPDERTVSMYAQGDTDDGGVEWGHDELIEGTVNEATESIFSLDYLEEVTKPIPDAAEVTINFGDEWPMIFEWEGLGGNLTVRELLAPRITRN